MGCRKLTTYDYFADVEAKPKSADRRNANKNVTELLDDTGTVRAHYEFSPFGQITRETGALSDQFDFRFSSESFEQETGLVYYNFRYYSPELGRWLKRDPIGEDGGYNLYLHTHNNPINKTDYLENLPLDPSWPAQIAYDYIASKFETAFQTYGKKRAILIADVAGENSLEILRVSLPSSISPTAQTITFEMHWMVIYSKNKGVSQSPNCSYWFFV